MEFSQKYVRQGSRTRDQMEQAARSGKQNIAEGSQASWTNKPMEHKLVGIARMSLEELLKDYEDFLRQKGFKNWDKDSPQAREVRNLVYRTDKSYKTYRTYINNPEQAANAMICLINQTNLLLDRQIESLEKDPGISSNFRASQIISKEKTDRKKADEWLMGEIWRQGNVRLTSGKVVKKDSKEAKQDWDEEFKKFVEELEGK